MTLIAMLRSAHTARTLCGIFLMAAASSGCSKHEESKETLLSRANGYLASAQYDKAEKEYREVLRLAPDDPVALRQLAIIYVEQGQLPQAYQASESRGTAAGRCGAPTQAWPDPLGDGSGSASARGGPALAREAAGRRRGTHAAGLFCRRPE